jgi:hypothetical protein
MFIIARINKIRLEKDFIQTYFCCISIVNYTLTLNLNPLGFIRI